MQESNSRRRSHQSADPASKVDSSCTAIAFPNWMKLFFLVVHMP